MSLERFTGFLTTADIHPTAYKNWVKHVVVQDDGHWRWTGGFVEEGYPRFRGPWNYAHRFAYLYRVGWLPLGRTFDVAHQCFQRWCVNWDCLEVQTRLENLWDREASRRDECAAGHEKAVHGWQDVLGRWKCRECRRLGQETWRNQHKDLSLERARVSDTRPLITVAEMPVGMKPARQPCPQCGVLFAVPLRGRPAKYCTKACAVAWRRAH